MDLHAVKILDGLALVGDSILWILVGVVGELVAFISFLSLSISVFLESIKHLIDVVVFIPKRENESTLVLTAHGHGQFAS